MRFVPFRRSSRKSRLRLRALRSGARRRANVPPRRGWPAFAGPAADEPASRSLSTATSGQTLHFAEERLREPFVEPSHASAIVRTYTVPRPFADRTLQMLRSAARTTPVPVSIRNAERMSGAPVPGERSASNSWGAMRRRPRSALRTLRAAPAGRRSDGGPGAVSVLESQREGLRLIVPGEEERRQRVFVPSRGISPPLPFGQGLDA